MFQKQIQTMFFESLQKKNFDLTDNSFSNKISSRLSREATSYPHHEINCDIQKQNTNNNNNSGKNYKTKKYIHFNQEDYMILLSY